MKTHIEIEIESIRSKLKRVDNKAAFAKRCGVSRATLYRFMNGEFVPSVETIKSLAVGLQKEPLK